MKARTRRPSARRARAISFSIARRSHLAAQEAGEFVEVSRLQLRKRSLAVALRPARGRGRARSPVGGSPRQRSMRTAAFADGMSAAPVESPQRPARRISSRASPWSSQERRAASRCTAACLARTWSDRRISLAFGRSARARSTLVRVLDLGGPSSSSLTRRRPPLRGETALVPHRGCVVGVDSVRPVGRVWSASAASGPPRGAWSAAERLLRVRESLPRRAPLARQPRVALSPLPYLAAAAVIGPVHVTPRAGAESVTPHGP